MNQGTVYGSFMLAGIILLQCTRIIGLDPLPNFASPSKHQDTDIADDKPRASGRPGDIPPEEDKNIRHEKAPKSNEAEFEMMRVKKARLLQEEQAKKKREPLKELVITDEAFFDIQVDDYHGPGEHRKERITIGCFGHLTQVTCLNFMSLSKGFRKGKDKLHYKGSSIKRVVPDFMVQMGYVRARHGSGNSIFGRVFPDESFALSHNHSGWVGMANYGADTNGSQFYILLKPSRWLDGKYVIFGKVTRGMKFIQSLGEEEINPDSEPLRNITIVDSGSVRLPKPIRLGPDEFNTDGDLLPPS